MPRGWREHDGAAGERRVVGVVEVVPLVVEVAGREWRRRTAAHVAGRLVGDVAYVPRVGGGVRGDGGAVGIGCAGRVGGGGGGQRAEQREGDGEQRPEPPIAPRARGADGGRCAAAAVGTGRADARRTYGDVSPGHRALLGLRRSHADVGTIRFMVATPGPPFRVPGTRYDVTEPVCTSSGPAGCRRRWRVSSVPYTIRIAAMAAIWARAEPKRPTGMVASRVSTAPIR